MPKWNGSWSAGRTYSTNDGRTVYVLRKRVDGRDYQITLDASSEQQAMAEYALFMQNPPEYRTKMQRIEAGTGLVLNDVLVGRYFDARKSERGTDAEKHLRDNVSYLAQWAKAFPRRDIRTITLKEYLIELNKHPTARKGRIGAIKSFTKWLRETAQLERKDDASLGLAVPGARPEKIDKVKGYSIEHIERLYSALVSENVNGPKSRRTVDLQVVRDILCVQINTGMHVTEVGRLARGGSSAVVRETPGQGEIAGVLRFVHKNQGVHLQSVDRQALEAALALQRRGSIPSMSFLCEIMKRLEAKSIPTIHFGEMRHTFVTVGLECGKVVAPAAGSGVPVERMSSTVGHKSSSTTRKFYDNQQVPPMVKLPIRLVNREDRPLFTVLSAQESPQNYLPGPVALLGA